MMGLSLIKTKDLGLQPGPTQTRLFSHRKKKFKISDQERNVAKTKNPISCAVTAQMISIFVFAYAYCWFFDPVVLLLVKLMVHQIITIL